MSWNGIGTTVLCIASVHYYCLNQVVFIQRAEASLMRFIRDLGLCPVISGVGVVFLHNN
jgi:hypothetical protein